MKLKIYSTDSRVDSFDVYANGVFKANVPITYAISTTVTNGSSSGDTSISKGGTAYVTLSAGTGYSLPFSITVTGATYTYDSSTGVVSLSAPTGDVSIEAECVSSGYNVRLTGSGEYDGRIDVYDGQGNQGTLLFTVSLDNNDTFDTTVTCMSGYLCIKLRTGSSYSYGTPSSGIEMISSSGDGAIYQVTTSGSITGIRSVGCLAKGTLITLADGSKKPIEDVTFDDELLVWDFYEGKLTTAKPKYMLPSKKTSYHYETELENGTIIKTVGKYGHRLFNADKNEFVYDTECVDDYVLLENGEKSKVVSCKKIEEETEFFNIITDKHYNLFANGILTSCRLSNRYGIENMKYTDEEKMTEAEVSDYIDKLKLKGFKGVE